MQGWQCAWVYGFLVYGYGFFIFSSGTPMCMCFQYVYLLFEDTNVYEFVVCLSSLRGHPCVWVCNVFIFSSGTPMCVGLQRVFIFSSGTPMCMGLQCVYLLFWDTHVYGFVVYVYLLSFGGGLMICHFRLFKFILFLLNFIVFFPYLIKHNNILFIFSISYKILQYFVYFYYVLISMWQAVRNYFFSCLLCFFVYSCLHVFLPSSSASLSYLFLLFPCVSIWENTRAWVAHFPQPY